MAPTPATGSLESLRAANRAQVVTALRVHGAISRAEIARRTGLSRSTVSNVVGDLQSSGLVHEVDGRVEPGTQGGRPAVPVALNASAGVALGIDFGHRHHRVAVSDLGHEILAEGVCDATWDAAPSLDLVAALARDVLGRAGIAMDQLVGAAMAFPAPIDSRTGTVGVATKIAGVGGLRIAEEISERLGFCVSVENEANACALAELLWGAGRGCTDLAYVKLGTGIGCGLVIDGQLFRGAGGTAGEIGHIAIDEAGAVCGCGNRGCLETYAGTEAVLDLLRPTYGSQITIADVVELAAQGDVACHRVISDAGRLVGHAIAMLCNVMNPERVIIGGELSAAGDLLLEPVRQAVRRSTVHTAGQVVEIVPGEIAERSELMGALALVLIDQSHVL